MSYQLNRMRRELDELRKQSSQLEQELETEREARIQQTALQSLVGQVNRPEQFMRILRSEGSLVERGGELLVKTSQGLCPLSDGVSELLGTADYEHFRTSSISKESSSAATPTAEPAGKFFEGGERMPTDQEIQEALANPGRSELFRELDSLMEPIKPPRAASYDPVRPTQGQSTTNAFMPSDAEIQQAIADPAKLAALGAKLEASM